jgi:adenine-specific DNA-methyltransferase
MTAPDVILSPPFQAPAGRLDTAANLLAREVGRLAGGLPPLEALHRLTDLYPALLSKRHRGALGAFYTPPALSERLLDLATAAKLDWSTARVLDPAAGGGAFLMRAAARMRAAMSASAPELVPARIADGLAGFELDPYAASMARAALEILLADLTVGAGRPLPALVRVTDTLEEPPAEAFDLVIGNPPYGRVGLTPDQRARFTRGLYGHANLYAVFTDIALRWTRPGGLIAYLTPTSLLGGQYYAALRRLLAAEAPPVAIDFVEARSGVFEDVLQETLLALYRKGARTQRPKVRHLKVLDEHTADVAGGGAITLPADPAAPWLAPREAAHSKLIAQAQAMPTRLSDWGYEVSTGPLVWNRFKDQMRAGPEKGAYPLIWAEAVTPDGRFILRAEKRGHAPWFKICPGDAWLVVDRPCVLVQRTTAKEQNRRLIAAALPAAFIEAHRGVVVENHLNMVRPVAEPRVSAAAATAFLNSDIADQMFRCISGSVAVSAFELRSMPVPSASAMGAIERLVARGAGRGAIEAAIGGLYEAANA